MEFQKLIGKTLDAVWAVLVDVHPAWADESTPSLTASIVNLELSNAETYEIEPCEIDLSPDTYPSLGLKILKIEYPPNLKRWWDGTESKAEKIEELSMYLPSKIRGIEESDPIQDGQEGVTSQISIVLEKNKKIILTHILPPTTLGITVEK